MATTQNGNVNRATANTVTAMRRSAVNRQCPECGRKSAIVRFSEAWGFGSACRWDDCNYSTYMARPAPPEGEQG